MCGRSSFALAPDEVVELYSRVAAGRARGRNDTGASNAEQHRQRQRPMLAMPDGDRGRYRPSPNVAPTSWLPVLSSRRCSGAASAAAPEAPSLSIEIMRWGISTSSPTLPFLINARAETAPSLARFAKMLSSPRGRGVVAADGYYEWEAQSKQPYFVRRSDGEPMLLAVLVARDGEGGSGGGKGGKRGEEDDDEKEKPCFVILTREPPRAMRWLHDRCPCIFPSEEIAREWLGAGSDDASAASAAREASELLSRAGAAVEVSFAERKGAENKSAAASSPPSSSPPLPPLLMWHPVTKEVGKTSYQRWDASKDVRLGGIASLFGRAEKKKEEQGERTAAGAATAGTAIKKEESPSPLLSPGVKRKQEGGVTAAAANQKQHQQLHPAKKAKPAAAAAAKTTPGKGQRSLDFFLSPKKEEEREETLREK